MEVYIDDMLVKLKEANDHVKHLMEMFNILRRFRIKLTPQKCVFGVEKFLGFIVNHRGIEANPAKIQALLDMKSSTSVKCKEFFKEIKVARKDFVWTLECEKDFRKIKEQLGNPPMLSKPLDGESLILYLAVSEYSISAVLWCYIRHFHEEVLDLLQKEELSHPWWILHVDESVNNGGAGACIVLVSPEGHHLMSAIHFKFYATKNDVEYEALINSLKITLEMGVLNLIVKSNSQLVVNQVNEGFQARGPRMKLYLRCTQRLLKKFKEVRWECLTREKNSNVDALAKMGSQQEAVLLGSIPLDIQEIPSIPEVEVMQIEEAPEETWMTPIIAYINKGILPEDKFKARRLRYQAARYVVYDGVLYKRGFNQLLLRCVDEKEGNYILREVHDGICDNH
ncbi:uncharacterized protein LOC141686125 [Apium graveolens]|uniref:uncharacterized protein LOC141686125 n=1 Tax=Apium graveolens TaxID=4045 RepID=UPI003D7A31F8